MTGTTTTEIKKRTPGQVRQLESIVRDAVAVVIEQDDPSHEAVQQAIDARPGLGEKVQTKLRELLKVETFADEEAGFNPDYDYPQGFNTKTLPEQISLLRKRKNFPNLGDPNQELLAKIASGEAELPEGAEGWFAIPNFMKLGLTYSEALQAVVKCIAKNRPLQNYLGDQLGPDKLRRTQHATEMFTRLAEMQGNPDILLVPAQFGKRHAGRSPRRARRVIRTGEASEFGLGAYEVACMLLTHPERLVHYNNLWIDCPGDEYDHFADGSWQVVPVWDFGGGRLELNAYWFGSARSGCGSASGFLPQ